MFHVDLGHGGGRWVGATNEGRMPRFTRKWGNLVVKSEIYRPAGIRSDPVAFWRFRIFGCYVRLVFHVDLGHGGGR